MNDKKLHCRNYNHGRANPPVSFCPNCGTCFNSQTSRKSCGEQKHQQDRKNRSAFCSDCGKDLNLGK